MHSSKKASEIARNGFLNEKDMANRFIEWEHDEDVYKLLERMGYSIDKVESVEAEALPGNKKTDVVVYVDYKGDRFQENLQVKLVSNFKRGYNQVNRQYVDDYKEAWVMEDDIADLLKAFAGEIYPDPSLHKTFSKKRFYAEELGEEELQRVLDFLTKNKMKIINYIFRGNDFNFEPEWYLITPKTESTTSMYLYHIDEVIAFYGEGPVKLTKEKRASFKLGRVILQRKGGERGAYSANQLQFKINPIEIITG